VIRGEPESALAEFIQLYKDGSHDLRKTKNLSYLDNGRILDNPSSELIDLDRSPIPNRKLLLGRYFFNRLDADPATVISASRGCLYSCSYCAPNALDQAIEIEYSKHNLHKPPLRLRNAENVVKEFKHIASLGYRGVEICDNQFVWDKLRVMEICEEVRYLGLEWICYARADHLKDREMLKSMRQAGCKLIYIGTESFCQEILDDINKDIDLADNYKAVELVRECGIRPEISVLLGASRLETKETIIHSLREAKKLKTEFVHYSIASPLPNTALYRVAKKEGWIKNKEFMPADNIREAMLDLPLVKSETLKAMIRRCYRGQYFSLRFIARQILSFGFLKRLNFKIRTLIKLIRYTYNE
jgi:anaerobic magnesium-protoporphyrin IX monomethyl ester cyclase